ncbi:hypothetical protein AALC25_15425 [Lachnospiraceae bacterium 29-84]
MFYDDYCSTENKKAIFKAIIGLSKNHRYMAIQDLLNEVLAELRELNAKGK